MKNNQNLNSTLDGNKIVIIGGSSGIGLATAKAAAEEGGKVVIVSGNKERINKALQQLPSNSEGYAIDASVEENIKTFFNKLGSFDHLVYTAGENISLGELSTTQLEQARDYFTIRYWGAVAAVKYATPHINKNGSITLISGIASQRPGKGWWLGASICSAMEGFAKAMSVELAPVRVNIVSPGIVKTNLWNSMTDEQRESMYQSAAVSLPVQRVGESEDIAQAFIYFIKQPYGTGQMLTVDGGSVRV